MVFGIPCRNWDFCHKIYISLLFAASDDKFESVTAVLGQKLTLFCDSSTDAVNWTRNDADVIYSGYIHRRYFSKFSVEIHGQQHNLILHNSSLGDAGKYVCSRLTDGSVIKKLNVTIVNGNIEHFISFLRNCMLPLI